METLFHFEQDETDIPNPVGSMGRSSFLASQELMNIHSNLNGDIGMGQIYNPPRCHRKNLPSNQIETAFGTPPCRAGNPVMLDPCFATPSPMGNKSQAAIPEDAPMSCSLAAAEGMFPPSLNIIPIQRRHHRDLSDTTFQFSAPQYNNHMYNI